jgi:hypothetical protein
MASPGSIFVLFRASPHIWEINPSFTCTIVCTSCLPHWFHYESHTIYLSIWLWIDIQVIPSLGYFFKNAMNTLVCVLGSHKVCIFWPLGAQTKFTPSAYRTLPKLCFQARKPKVVKASDFPRPYRLVRQSWTGTLVLQCQIFALSLVPFLPKDRACFLAWASKLCFTCALTSLLPIPLDSVTIFWYKN